MNKKFKRTLWGDIKYYLYYAPLNYLDMLPRRIYWFFQRGFRGYGDNNVWDFDNYLIDIISNGLKQLKKYQHGIPTEIYEKHKGKYVTQTEEELKAQQEWNQILDKIIEGFDCAKVYIEYFCELEHEEKIKIERIRQEGFDLFKEYFFNLWD